MYSYVVSILCIALLYQSVLGLYFRNFPDESKNKHYDFDFTSEEIQNFTSNILNDIPEVSNNISEYQAGEQFSESTSNILASEIMRNEESNSTFTPSTPVPSTKNMPETQSTRIEMVVSEKSSNGSNSTTSMLNFSGSSSSSTRQTTSDIKTTALGTFASEEIIMSSTEYEEPEGVVRGKPSSTEITNTTTSKAETIYQKALALINDTYVLSILVPVAAGVIFASAIIITLATCRCLRRQCRYRRLRKKTLPDSVKNLRPSDRARLLAESSDEEF